MRTLKIYALWCALQFLRGLYWLCCLWEHLVTRVRQRFCGLRTGHFWRERHWFYGESGDVGFYMENCGMCGKILKRVGVEPAAN